MKIVDLTEAKTKDKKHKAARDKLKKLPKQPKTIASILERIKAIEEYLGLCQ